LINIKVLYGIQCHGKAVTYDCCRHYLTNDEFKARSNEDAKIKIKKTIFDVAVFKSVFRLSLIKKNTALFQVKNLCVTE